MITYKLDTVFLVFNFEWRSAITGNTANNGGGVYRGTTRSCTIVHNTVANATSGGVFEGQHYNGIIFYNTARP